MKKLQRTSVFLIFSCMVSCNGTLRRETTNNTSIEIIYLKGMFETGTSISCGALRKGKPRPFFLKPDTFLILKDKQKYIEITNQVKTLKKLKDSTSNCDVRMQCKINYANGDTVQLCIGEFNCLVKDGRRMEKNDSLVYLLRKYSGYYNYFPEYGLKYFDELKRFGMPKDYRNLSGRNPDGSLKP